MSSIWWYLIGLATVPALVALGLMAASIADRWCERHGQWGVYVVYPDGETDLHTVRDTNRRKAEAEALRLRKLYVANPNRYYGEQIVAAYVDRMPKVEQEEKSS